MITEVNGKTIRSFMELRGKIGSIGAGKDVELTLSRDGEEMMVTATLLNNDGASVVADNIHSMMKGATLANNSDGDGVSVTEVNERSPAQAIGLEKNDVIIGVNRKKIEDVGDLRNALEAQSNVFALQVVRGSTVLYLMIR